MNQSTKFFKAALIVVAASFLFYTIYQSITTTIFVLNFPTVIKVLPTKIESSNPTLQLGLFLFQETAGSIGGYFRLAGAILAISGAVLYFRGTAKYLARFRLVVLFESLYFLLLLPAAVNHLIGSTISTSAFLNFYTGISTLLQALLIFPPLFMLSRKLKNPQNIQSIQKWACIAAPLYVLGFWVRHALFWVYALSSGAPPQTGVFEAVGFVDSCLTLLVASLFTVVICFKFMQKKQLNLRLISVDVVLVGAYFAVYDLVAVWLPSYRAFLPLTDFWMVTLPILGIAVYLLGQENLTIRESSFLH
jgi:hypothetical protein